MAERHAGRDSSPLPFVTSTPSAPGVVVSLAIGFGLTVLLLVAVFVADRGGRPLFASVMFAAVALALTTFNLMF